MPVRIALCYQERRYFDRSAGPASPLFTVSQEFLDAYLRHGTWTELVALLPDAVAVESFKQICFDHPSSRVKPRRLQWVQLRDFFDTFRTNPPARLLHFSSLPDAHFAWARHSARRQPFGVSGMVHSVGSVESIESLRSLVTAPFEPYDRVICASSSLVHTVRSVSDAYADYLREQHGGRPRRRVSLELIPPGVDTDRIRPATPEQRAAQRARRNITEEEIVVLFAGRLSHYAEAHPFPLLKSISTAASRAGKKVHLLLSGGPVSTPVLDALKDGARQFAENVRCSMIAGTSDEHRSSIYHAADIFAFLADSLQETYGFAILEAMACGLPVVASDWNGHRELIVEDETGFCIPTLMIRQATSDLTVRLLCGEIDYDHFLARASQSVVVDVVTATEAFTRLFADRQLRDQLGQAGRERAEREFCWPRIIAAHEQLWSDQLVERDRAAGRTQPRAAQVMPAYPAPDDSFSSYPSKWMDDHERVRATPDAAERVRVIHSLPLTNHEAESRCDDLTVLQEALTAARVDCPLSDLLRVFFRADVQEQVARATVAWLLKYHLLQTVQPLATRPAEATHGKSGMTFVTTCMGRLSFLKQTLPHMVAQEGCDCVVVDYSCPDRAGDWVQQHYPQVHVVRCPGQTTFQRSHAKNAGVRAAGTPWVCLIDADIVVKQEFASQILGMVSPGEFYRVNYLPKGLGGTIVFQRHDFDRVGGHDSQYVGWGEEDYDFCDALAYAGVEERFFPSGLVEHLEHDDTMRIQFHEDEDRDRRWRVNRLYRLIKWDLARLNGELPSQQQREQLYGQVDAAVQPGPVHEAQEIVVDPRTMQLGLGTLEYARRLVYRV